MKVYLAEIEHLYAFGQRERERERVGGTTDIYRILFNRSVCIRLTHFRIVCGLISWETYLSQAVEHD